MKIVSLGEVASIERNSVDPSRIPLKTPYIGLEHIQRGGRIVGVSTVGRAGLKSAKFRFTESDVLFGKLRPNLGKIARPDFSGVCSTDILPIHPTRSLDRGYLAHFLAQPEIIDFAASRATGANLPRLSPKILAQFQVALPSLTEQRRIASILDKADSVRAKRHRILAHLDDLTQSIFYDMFGDPRSSEHTHRLGDLAELKAGRNLVGDDRDSISPFKVLRISAVTTGIFDASQVKPLPKGYVPPESHLVHEGDLLMSRANTTELVGATAIVDSAVQGLALPDKVWRFEFKDPGSSPVFYQALLQTAEIRALISGLASGSGGSMKNISKTKLYELPLPAIDAGEQRAFEEQVLQVRGVRRRVCSAMATDTKLFASLQSRAFKGEL